jgi:hypothetical protein
MEEVGVSGTRGRKRFQAAASAALLSQLRLDEEWPTISAAWINHAFGDEPSPSGRQLDARGEFVRRLLTGWAEINRSLETLGDVAVYVTRFPPARMVPRQRYLRFLVEAYYNELYIFSERLRAFTTRVVREYRGDPRLAEVQRAATSARELADVVLSGHVRVRGEHVHVGRLAHAAIERLESLWALFDLAPQPLPRAVVRYREQEYQRIRAEVRARIAEDNKAISLLLDHFCDCLFPVFFSPHTNELLYPSEIRSAPTARRQSRGVVPEKRGAAQQGDEADEH